MLSCPQHIEPRPSPMADFLTRSERSKRMAAIRSMGNLTTELRMVMLLREHLIRGWQRHQKLPGRPDFVFRKEKLALFVDGCFWHGCPRCYRAPSTRSSFWREKVESNRRRDRRVDRELRKKGWSVARVWECSLRKRPNEVAGRVARMLEIQVSK